MRRLGTTFYKYNNTITDVKMTNALVVLDGCN